MDDETIITLRRHGNPSGPRLVMSHGNGLSTDLYYPFWSLLADDYDIIAYDLRNHGWNSASSMQDHNLPTLVHDHDVIMEAIDAHYGEKPKVRVVHSISALTTLLFANLGADPTLPYSYLPTLDLRDVFTVNYDFLPESTHLLQLEQTGRCAALVWEFLQEMAHA